MTNKFEFNRLVLAEINHEQIIRFFPRRPTVRVLIVADTSVSFTTDFGIGMVVDLIRANADGYVNFVVDLARLGTKTSTISVNSAPGPRGAKYLNFRFASQLAGQYVVDGYDQVWCFGFAPGNDASSDDSNIWDNDYASTDTDLAVLTRWMNDGGGVLAMGDHHYLGASMCARIPRVRSMRRWTNAQSVPPQFGVGRFDTNRPQTAAQDATLTANPDRIPDEAQRDGVPQQITWKRYNVWSFRPWVRRHRPHPLLCGGQLGVIDVLPDHPHEGWVYEDGDIDVSAEYRFEDPAGDFVGVEYPSNGTVQPRPEAIAWANTLPDPPYWHNKGDSPAKRFAVIGVYDGDAVDVGRVVVDSTWHHWMDMNLVGLAAESTDTEYQKIVRYFRNCAVWLSREGQRRQMLTYATFWSTLLATSYEDFNRHEPILTLGTKAIDVIGRLTSDCLVHDWLTAYIPDRFRLELTRPIRPMPEPCWSCPPFELLEQMVMGGIVKAILPLRDELDRLHRDPKAKLKLDHELVHTATQRGAAAGLEAFRVAIKHNLARLEEVAALPDIAIKQERPSKAKPEQDCGD